MSTVLSTSLKGASYLISVQVFSRAITFVVNQLLLRLLSPELLGISAQLELYSITVLYFARESIRVACQRQASNPQAVVNVACLAVIFGAPLAVLLASIYSSVEGYGVAYFSDALKLYAVACVIELFAEPAFVTSQRNLQSSVRASAEMLATISRCFGTCAVAVWANRNGASLGALPFAVGQLSYAVTLLAVYAVQTAPLASSAAYSLFPRRIEKEQNGYYFGYFSKSLTGLAGTLLLQNSLKYFLTQGDGILIAAVVSLREQGAYALASNYGGLIARMLFQPIEEVSRNTFAQLCSPAGSKKDRLDAKGISSARNLLQDVLRFYGILGIVACAIGPSAAPVLLRFVAGSRWSDTDASSVLVSYCYYIPLLAINGVTEAFVTAVAPVTTLHQQSVLMFVWFAAFAGSSYVFVSVLGLGGSGLVYANCVNMALRIVFNTHFASRFFGQNEAPIEISSALPSVWSLSVGVGAWSILHSSFFAEHLRGESLNDLGMLGSAYIIFGSMILIFERSFLLRWVHTIRNRH